MLTLDSPSKVLLVPEELSLGEVLNDCLAVLAEPISLVAVELLIAVLELLQITVVIY